MGGNTHHHHEKQNKKPVDRLRCFLGHFYVSCPDGRQSGMQDMLASQFDGFATNSGFMGTNQTSKAYKGFRKGRWWDLENKDVERVRRAIPEIDVVTPTIAKWGMTALYKENKINCTLKGVYPEYTNIEEPVIVQGRFINMVDVKSVEKFVSSASVSTKLYSRKVIIHVASS